MRFDEQFALCLWRQRAQLECERDVRLFKMVTENKNKNKNKRARDFILCFWLYYLFCFLFFFNQPFLMADEMLGI